MFVQTSYTPNPKTMKFIPPFPVSAHPSEFGRSDRDIHPFFHDVFDTDDVTGVFLGPDFVSVTLSSENDWSEKAKQRFRDLILKHGSGIGEISASNRRDEDVSDDCKIVSSIKSVLEKHVRPAVASDGGDIVFKSFSSGVLTLEMRGACSGCPSSTATLQIGIQNLMNHFVPEVREVRSAA